MLTFLHMHFNISMLIDDCVSQPEGQGPRAMLGPKMVPCKDVETPSIHDLETPQVAPQSHGQPGGGITLVAGSRAQTGVMLDPRVGSVDEQDERASDVLKAGGWVLERQQPRAPSRK